MRYPQFGPEKCTVGVKLVSTGFLRVEQVQTGRISLNQVLTLAQYFIFAAEGNRTLKSDLPFTFAVRATLVKNTFLCPSSSEVHNFKSPLSSKLARRAEQ